MTQIARCDWLPERARWSHLAPSGLPALSRKQNYPKSHIINPLLTKFDRSRWLGIGLVLFCEFMDRDEVEVDKHAKKELGQYPAILTSHLVNNPYVFVSCFDLLRPFRCRFYCRGHQISYERQGQMQVYFVERYLSLRWYADCV